MLTFRQTLIKVENKEVTCPSRLRGEGGRILFYWKRGELKKLYKSTMWPLINTSIATRKNPPVFLLFTSDLQRLQSRSYNHHVSKPLNTSLCSAVQPWASSIKGLKLNNYWRPLGDFAWYPGCISCIAKPWWNIDNGCWQNLFPGTTATVSADIKSLKIGEELLYCGNQLTWKSDVTLWDSWIAGEWPRA